MANRLNTEVIPSAHKHQYAWSEWLDGGVWELTQGEDFDCGLESFRQQAHGAATRHSVKVKTRIDKTRGVVILQAFREGGQA